MMGPKCINKPVSREYAIGGSVLPGETAWLCGVHGWYNVYIIRFKRQLYVM